MSVGLRDRRVLAGRLLRNVLAAASFTAFAAAVLLLHQDRNVPFPVEMEGPVPVALSHALFGTRLGEVDSVFNQYFVSQSHDVAAATLIEQAVAGKTPRGGEPMMAHDGIGVGAITVTQIDFAFFGLHAVALPLGFLLLLGVTTLCFLGRYQDARLALVPTIFFAYVVLFYAVEVGLPEGFKGEVPIGGERSYALLAILPALHLCFDFLDGGRTRSSAWIRWTLFAVQGLVLVVAIFMRDSLIYLLVPIAIFASVGWRRGRKTVPRTRTLAPVVILALALICLMASPQLIFPEYAHQGRLHSLLWHRMFVGLAVHPDWPFRGMREKYDCTRSIPEGLVRRISDRNAQCVWHAFDGNASRPAAEVNAEIYDADYESALRQAFFDTLKTHPREVFETFAFYKPRVVVTQIGRVLEAALRYLLLPFVILQGAIWAMVLATQLMTLRRFAAQSAGVLVICALGALGPPTLAWSNAAASLDLMAYVVIGFVLGVAALLGYGIERQAHARNLRASAKTNGAAEAAPLNRSAQGFRRP